jgi:hypothetical protein
VFFRSAGEGGVIQIVGIVFEFRGELGDRARKTMVMDINSAFAGEDGGGERVDFVRHDVDFSSGLLCLISFELERVVSPSLVLYSSLLVMAETN